VKTGETFNLIVRQQKEWASKRAIQSETTGSWETHTKTLNANLFQELFAESRAEFEAGAGKELDKHMLVLWSSSALVVNIFDYWRRHNRIAEIATACGAPSSMNDMAYEKRYKIGRHGIAHLDIEFTGGNSRFAIEAKFTEPYRYEFNMNKYLAVDDYWQNLPRCKKLAEEIVQREQCQPGYKHLNATQLVKHILGLSYRQNEDRNFALLYLWYDANCLEADEHREEIRYFTDMVKGDIDFKSMTYQQLFANIQNIPNVSPEYLDYLKGRYFR